MPTPDADWAFTKWAEFYGMDPAWNGKQWKQLHELQQLLGPWFRPTWEVFLANRDTFYRGHSPAKLVMDVDKFRVMASAPKSERTLFNESEPSPKLKEAVQRNLKLQTKESDKRRGTREAMLKSSKTDRMSRGEAKVALAKIRERMK